AHRYDYETPLEETMQAFADIVRAGKALYIGVSEWNADQLRAAHHLARDLGIQLVSNQPQYNMLWRVIEDRVIPTSKELGISQVVWSPIAQGALTGKYKPGQPAPAGSRATDEAGGGADSIKSRYLNDETLTAVAGLEPIAADLGLTMAQLAVAWVLANDNVSTALVGASRPEQIASNAEAAGVTLDGDVPPRHRDGPEHDPVAAQPPRASSRRTRDQRRPRRQRRSRRHRCLLRVDPPRNAGPDPAGSTRRRHPPAGDVHRARPAAAVPAAAAPPNSSLSSHLRKTSSSASSARHLPARSISARSRVGEITVTRLCLGEGRALNCMRQLYNLGIEFLGAMRGRSSQPPKMSCHRTTIRSERMGVGCH